LCRTLMFIIACKFTGKHSMFIEHELKIRIGGLVLKCSLNGATL